MPIAIIILCELNLYQSSRMNKVLNDLTKTHTRLGKIFWILFFTNIYYDHQFVLTDFIDFYKDKALPYTRVTYSRSFLLSLAVTPLYTYIRIHFHTCWTIHNEGDLFSCCSMIRHFPPNHC